MCGIIAHFGSLDKSSLEEMAKILEHRGPDNTGFYQDKDRGINLAHTRLKIIDLYENANQPFVSECKNYIIVYNGEIYNSPELRKKITSLKFQTKNSDTETILNYYIEYGETVVNELEGMFAFVIVDLKKKLIISARDHFGQKPLYFTSLNNELLFSSELTGIEYLHKEKLNKSKLAMAKYFAYDSIPAPYTLYENVFKLEPATIQVHELQTLKLIRNQKFWKPNYSREIEEINYEELDSILTRTAESSSLSDVPLSLMLSGGVDSSLVGYYLTREEREVSSFNMGFDRKSFDETERAIIASKLLGTKHKSFQFETLFNSDELDRLYSNLDEPNGDSGLIPYYLLSRKVSENFKVAIGGDGGDEPFLGYDTHKAFALTRKLPKKLIKKPLGFISSLLPNSHDRLNMKFKLERFSNGLGGNDNLMASKWMSSQSAEKINNLIGTSFSDEDIFSEAIELWESTSSNIYDKFNSYYLNIYLPSKVLAKVDRASMLNGLEVRSPLLDTKLYEYSLKYSIKNFHNGSENKICLRELLKRKVSKKLASYPKRGFASPISELIGLNLVKEKISNIDFINPEYVNSVLENHLKSYNHNEQFLWNVFALSYKT
jgi:asparagine synthase (glutamine-hydrolysing)